MREDKRLRRKVRRSYIVSTISISMVLFMLGSVGYMLTAALTTAYSLRHSITLSAELDNSVTEQQLNVIEQEISSIEGVEHVEYLSKESKIEDVEFRHMFATEIENILEDNPLRNSFEVAVATNDRASTDALVDKLSGIGGVVYVAYPASTIEQLHSSLRKITIVLIVFGGALFVISIILLNNTIRLAIFSRRYLINTLKLVGATKSYIKRPFLATAAKKGVWAGIIASLLFLAAIAGLSGTIPELIATTELIKIGIVVGAMIISGLVISLIFTSFAVGKFVNMKSNKIYLY
ncbi:MAG: permease-like cell division protein FtsX [Alistipes sp.]|nr:permease-like cell division protein FtsX [Alistipes sp.]